MQGQPYEYDCALSKEESKLVYNALIVPHLTQIRKPEWGFDGWYAQLDSWDRTMIYASKLKKYLLSVGYNNWVDIN